MILKEEENKKLNILLYFQVHQPRRLNYVNFIDTSNQPRYFNDDLNESIVRRIARDCYLPANNLLLQLIDRHPEIKVTFSLSGVVIEQLQNYAPEVLESFQRLVATGSVEFLAEPYFHSLASLVNGDEFEVQVLQHAEKMMETFGVRPTVFTNTELIYSDDIGRRVAMMGYRGIFAEGHESILGTRTPNRLYNHPDHEQLKLFLRHHRLSDDIAFRFIQGREKLHVSQYLSWLHGIPAEDKLINLAMDYETFGEHQKSPAGILDFLEELVITVATSDRFKMILPSEALDRFPDTAPLSIDKKISWCGLERGISAWLGNDIQKQAFKSVMKLEGEIRNLGEQELLKSWRCLQTSDHFFYMSVESDNEGSIHSYVSPYASSYDAFTSYMNVVSHLSFQIQTERNKPVQDVHDLSSTEAERQEVKASTPVWVMNLESVPQGNIPDTHG